MSTDFTIRHLNTLDEYEAAVELQYATWGPNFTGCVPASLLRVTQRIGGITAGAFAPSGELAGFVYGITGMQNGRPLHWSDILAVQTACRGYGLGKRLKWFQRAELLNMGVETVQWTYDPIQALNANLNLNALGAHPVEYIENMYGDTRSDLHAGLGTDRFVAQWDLASDRVEGLARGDGPQFQAPPSAPIVNSTRSEDGVLPLENGELPNAETVLVEIPASVNDSKDQHPESALAWRRCSRRAFLHYLNQGYAVGGFGEFSKGRYAYWLEKKGA